MTDKKCLCTGIKMARRIVEVVDDPTIRGQLKDAEKIYQHLLEESNKPENAALKKQVEKRLEEIRTKILQDSFTEGNVTKDGVFHPAHPGVMAMDKIKDEIHVSPELKQLLICGSSFEDKKELKNVLAVVETVWNITATAGEASSPYEDVSEAYGPLDDLAKHYECDKI